MRISVVTTCRNSARTIGATFESVLAQHGVDLEYIVADGGSTDGTVELIRALETRLVREGRTDIALRWTSASDRGIYDGIDRGLALATGDVVGLLNADDRFEDAEVLADVAKAFAALPADVGAVYGDIRFADDAGRTTRYYSSRPWRPWMHRWGYMPAHPSVYVRRDVLTRFGDYRADYRISGDFEWMVRVLCRGGVAARYLPRCFVAMRAGGASTDWRGKLRLNAENVRAERANGYFSCLPMMLPKYAFKALGLVRGKV